MRTANAIDTPISTCCSTSINAWAESSGTTGIGGSEGCTANAMRNESATRTRIGTVRWPITGTTPNRASTRRNGHSSWLTQAQTCASSKVSMARWFQ